MSCALLLVSTQRKAQFHVCRDQVKEVIVGAETYCCYTGGLVVEQ